MMGASELSRTALPASDPFFRFLTGEGGPGRLFWRFTGSHNAAAMGKLLMDLICAREVVAEEDFFWYKMIDRAVREGCAAEDTLESANIIDWAILIPQNVRSCFVKPFLHGDRVNMLLFFCSPEPRRFSVRDADRRPLFFPSFLKMRQILVQKMKKAPFRFPGTTGGRFRQ